MAFEKVEYKFPDPDDTAKQNIEIEDLVIRVGWVNPVVVEDMSLEN